MSFIDELNELFSGQNAPYLFVGSGFSRRYFNTPGWEELLREIAVVSGLKYGNYVDSQDNLPQVASNMASDVRRAWYDEKFKEYEWGNIENLEDIGLHKEAALKYITCNLIENRIKNDLPTYLDENKSAESLIGYDKAHLVEEMRIFSKLNPPAIITTNYDSALEKIFSDYKVYGSQIDMISASLYGMGEIYKIHGTVDNHLSIILTEGDYNNFLNKNKYLIAKLLTIFTENPIVFIGYSLSDENIREIFMGINECLGESADIKGDYARKFIFLNRLGEGEEERVYVAKKFLSKHLAMKVTVIQTNDFRKVYEAMLKVKIQVPARVLSFLRERIYEILNDPQEMRGIRFKNIEELEKEWQNGGEEKLIAGLTFSAPQNAGLGRSFQRMGADAVRDGFMSGRDSGWNVYEYIRYFLASNSGKWLPIHRYLNNISLQDFKSNISSEDAEMLSAKVKAITAGEIKSAHISVPAPLDREYQNVNQVVNLGAHKYEDNSGKKKSVTVGNMGNIILKMNESKISEADLFKFISGNKDKLKQYGQVYPKIICLYDYIKYADNPVSQHVLKL